MANFNTARLAEDIKREISTAMRDINLAVGQIACQLTA